MSRTSGGTDLSTRLQQKIEQERKQIEAVTQKEFEKLEGGLRWIVSNALDTIESDTRRISEVLRRAWIRPLVIGLMFFLGMVGGSWGLMGWLSNSIESHIRTRAALQAEIESQEKTIERLKEKTWGILLHQDEGGRFVVFPKGEFGDDWKGLTFRGRPVWELKDR